jgi:bifunctional non-homologous end joining protein LigD
MPLSWSQVTKKLQPARYTVRTVPPLLFKADPWEDYASASVPLIGVLKKLVNVKRAA